MTLIGYLIVLFFHHIQSKLTLLHTIPYQLLRTVSQSPISSVSKLGLTS